MASVIVRLGMIGCAAAAALRCARLRLSARTRRAAAPLRLHAPPPSLPAPLDACILLRAARAPAHALAPPTSLAAPTLHVSAHLHGLCSDTLALWRSSAGSGTSPQACPKPSTARSAHLRLQCAGACADESSLRSAGELHERRASFGGVGPAGHEHADAEFSAEEARSHARACTTHAQLHPHASACARPLTDAPPLPRHRHRRRARSAPTARCACARLPSAARS
jgi:hypothetical protein